MKMFSTHKHGFVHTQCNNHDKIGNVDRFEENPRPCSDHGSTNAISPDRAPRSQQYAGHTARRRSHARHIGDAFSPRRATAFVRTILLFGIFALLAECRELPPSKVQNPGESSRCALCPEFNHQRIPLSRLLAAAVVVDLGMLGYSHIMCLGACHSASIIHRYDCKSVGFWEKYNFHSRSLSLSAGRSF